MRALHVNGKGREGTGTTLKAILKQQIKADERRLPLRNFMLVCCGYPNDNSGDR